MQAFRFEMIKGAAMLSLKNDFDISKNEIGYFQ